nr:hypothetical protein [Tanacetum cinerariifolium]
MVAILEKTEHNTDFHQIVEFLKASHIRRNLKLRDEDGIVSIPDTELFENLTLMGQYSRRARIAQSSALPTVADEPASLVRDVSEGEACPTESGLIADQDRATIAKSSTLPHDSVPRVTSPAADKGSMQQTIFELTALCTSLQRQYSELLAKFQAQEEEILRLKERGRSINEGEAAAERISNDSEEVARVLTSIDVATVLERGIDVPTGSGSIPTAGPPATVISTGSEVGPTANPIVTSFSRRKGKEVMVESNTLKKQRLQEHINAQVARELKEQQEREDMRMNEQIARDAELARIHPEEDLQGMIDSLDKNNLGCKVKDFKGFSFKEIEAKFAKVWKQVKDFIPKDSKEKAERLKRKVKEYLSIRPATSEKEMELWVELKRLYEPDPEDQLWTLKQNFMHAHVEWKLYDLSGVHHLTAKDKEIFMLVEKDYPLRKGLAFVMISYKLQVENYSQMAEDLIRKIYNISNTPRQQGD